MMLISWERSKLGLSFAKLSSVPSYLFLYKLVHAKAAYYDHYAHYKLAAFYQ